MTGRKRICIVVAVLIVVCIGGMAGCSARKKVMDFPRDEIESIELFLYDSKNQTTTMAWCYKEEDMEEVLSYLSSLEGKRISQLPVVRWPEQFWGVRLNGYNTVYKLLIVGDYAITADGKYYEINGGKANEVYGSMPAIDKYKWEGLTGIVNVRYIAERNGSYDTAFMQKVTPQVRKAVPEAVMKTAQDSYSAEDTEITFTIENCGDTDLEYGSQVSLEVLIDGDWYDMNNMLTENVDIGWTDELRIQQPETVVEDTFYIKYYQPLCKGTYRLVKEFSINGEKGYAACEFEIE